METQHPVRLGRSQHHREKYSLLSLFQARLAFGPIRPPALIMQRTPASRWLRSFVLVISISYLLWGWGCFFFLITKSSKIYLSSRKRRNHCIRENALKNQNWEQFNWGIFDWAVLLYSQSLLCTEWKGSETRAYGAKPLRKCESAVVMTHKS